MAPPLSSGMVHLESPYSFEETLNRLESTLRARGIVEFARIDHGGEAAKIGLKMHPTQVVIFGSPRAGTPLMEVWISYNTAEYLAQRHNVPSELIANIAVTGPLLQNVVK